MMTEDLDPTTDDTEDETEEIPPTVWDLLEEPPPGCEDVASLYSWSLNFDPGKGPMALFLDLIGYSEEEYGETMSSSSADRLGYHELIELADALKAYTEAPGDVRAY